MLFNEIIQAAERTPVVGILRLKIPAYLLDSEGIGDVTVEWTAAKLSQVLKAHDVEIVCREIAIPEHLQKSGKNPYLTPGKHNPHFAGWYPPGGHVPGYYYMESASDQSSTCETLSLTFSSGSMEAGSGSFEMQMGSSEAHHEELTKEFRKLSLEAQMLEAAKSGKPLAAYQENYREIDGKHYICYLDKVSVEICQETTKECRNCDLAHTNLVRLQLAKKMASKVRATVKHHGVLRTRFCVNGHANSGAGACTDITCAFNHFLQDYEVRYYKLAKDLPGVVHNPRQLSEEDKRYYQGRPSFTAEDIKKRTQQRKKKPVARK